MPSAVPTLNKVLTGSSTGDAGGTGLAKSYRPLLPEVLLAVKLQVIIASDLIVMMSTN